MKNSIIEPAAHFGKQLWLFVKRRKLLLGILVIFFAVLLWLPTIYTNIASKHLRYDLDKTAITNVPKKDVAIVFGAGILPDGEPTPYLKWRVETAVKLYKAHRVQKLLMTGDNSSTHHNEPVAMGKLAEKLGVPSKDIVLDYAGLNTYDSCYRAHAIFGVKSAIAVSQGYHLPRATMTCKGLGIDTIGVRAQHNEHDFTASYLLREWLSTDKMVFQLIFKPHPTALGGRQTIDFTK